MIVQPVVEPMDRFAALLLTPARLVEEVLSGQELSPPARVRVQLTRDDYTKTQNTKPNYDSIL